MKTMVLELLKKNRVYFKIKLESGHEAKLKITSASENLELGKHTLLVNDVSVRYVLNRNIEEFESHNLLGNAA